MRRRTLPPAMVAIGAGCFFAACAGVALTYSAPAAAVPLVIALPALVLCLLQARADSRGGRDTGPAPVATDSGGLLRAWLWFVGFVAAAILLGIAAGPFIMIVAYLVRVARIGPAKALLTATVFWAAVMALVELVLNMPLETGLLLVFANR